MFAFTVHREGSSSVTAARQLFASRVRKKRRTLTDVVQKFSHVVLTVVVTLPV